jgi:Domain of unknown function (DUF5668)/N-terminal domain of toast_rack, DUF2154
MQTTMAKPSGLAIPTRSLFWPLLLIGIGVIWLLRNVGIFSNANLAVLLRAWPLLLIVMGIDLLFGRESPRRGLIIGVTSLILLLALMIAVPALGWGKVEVKTQTYSAPLNGATAARVTLNLSAGPTTVKALTDSDKLLDASLNYLGDIQFSDGGSVAERVVSFTNRNDNINWLDWLSTDKDLRWDIGLNPSVPVNLDVNGGAGSVTLDLSSLKLTGLTVDGGAGVRKITLPNTGSSYTVRLTGGAGASRLDIVSGATLDVQIDGGAGSSNITVGDGAAVNIRIQGGAGNVNIDVPDGAALRVEVNGGPGNVRLLSSLNRVSGDERSRNRGTWETPGFSSAERKIVITFDGGAGSLTVR